MKLSARVQEIKPSPTLGVAAKAAKLKAEGKSIINLGVGEPDFDTPEHIKAAAIKAIQEGFTKYTLVEGTLSLREAIIQKFKRDNSLQYYPNEILVSCGAKQSFFNLMQAYLNPQDEVIIPAPFWVSYPDMVLLAEAKPVIIPTTIQQHFKITPAQLEAAITPKTKLFIINSPSNPSGMEYTAAELQALAEVLLRHPQILIATDDMYEHTRFEKTQFHNLATISNALFPRTIVINGVSKTYAMTGWRIGYAAGPARLIEAMATIQSQSTSNPCSIAQVAAQAALEGNQDCVQQMVDAFKERHDYIVRELNNIPGMQCLKGNGTFYTFVHVQEIIDRIPSITDDTALAEFFLQEAGVATVPGTAFGCPGYLRFSFATELENLKTAIHRIRMALDHKRQG